MFFSYRELQRGFWRTSRKSWTPSGFSKRLNVYFKSFYTFVLNELFEPNTKLLLIRIYHTQAVNSLIPFTLLNIILKTHFLLATLLVRSRKSFCTYSLTLKVVTNRVYRKDSKGSTTKKKNRNHCSCWLEVTECLLYVCLLYVRDIYIVVILR